MARQATDHKPWQRAETRPDRSGRAACVFGPGIRIRPTPNAARLDGLEPAEVWRHFAAISDIPRGSGKEGAAIAYVTGVAAQIGLQYETDAVGNVLIRKPATKGMTDRTTIALQCHLDMVQVCEPGLAFDFATQGVSVRVDGDWLRSEGTTLGADNGIGVALILAVLSATDLPHPDIEALFTVDEEIGMTGALAVSPRLLTAEMMINLDMGTDSELTIGCAGTLDVILSGNYATEEPSAGQDHVRITVAGGAGGHSGEDIHLGRANTIHLLGAILSELAKTVPFRVVEIVAPGQPNVIPGGASAVLAVGTETVRRLDRILKDIAVERLLPFADRDPDLDVSWVPVTCTSSALMAIGDQHRLLEALAHSPTGVVEFGAMSEGLVETSCNLGALLVRGGSFKAISLIRSGTERGKGRVLQDIRAAWRATGASCATANDTPAWPTRPRNPMLAALRAAHIAETGEAPRISAIHAALECGVLAARFPRMAMVAYGPTMRGIHTTQECLQISSTKKVWAILKRTLATLPCKGDPHDSA